MSFFGNYQWLEGQWLGNGCLGGRSGAGSGEATLLLKPTELGQGAELTR